MLPYTNPQGYKQLRTWQQANEILELAEQFCATFTLKDSRTGQYLSDLKDQILRSARSVVRNIEEGFARTTTKEYISFLGFSRGSLEELLRDFEHCLVKGDKGKQGDFPSRHPEPAEGSPTVSLAALQERSGTNVGKDIGIGNQELAERGFYLCKGEGKMLYNQIVALENKMLREKTLPRDDMARRVLSKQVEQHREANKWLQEMTENFKKQDENKG